MGIRRGACAYTAAMRTVALVTAVAATRHDDDLVPLLDACADAGLHARAVAWDDPTVNWGRFDTVLLRSPWDYVDRLPEFLAWCERIARLTALWNPPDVVRWNTDKRYLGELAARLRALVRRAHGVPTTRLMLGEVALDPAARQVWRGGEPVELSVREFDLLRVFMLQAGRVLSREQLGQHLYKWGSEGSSNAVEVHIHNLRRKLGAELIETVRGVGYVARK